MGEATENDTHIIGWLLRKFLTGFSQIVSNGSRHRIGMCKARVVGIDETIERGLEAQRIQRVHIRRNLPFRPFLSASLQKPKPGNVLEETNRAVQSAFVREVMTEARFVDDGRRTLDAKQAPGTTTQVSVIAVLSRNGSHS